MPTLLIVDDEPNVRYSLEKYLRSETLDVICAASGKEAIEKTRAQHPDAVVLDVRLPDMSGLEVFDRIRHIDPRLPVVIITAHATTEIAIEAMKRGAFEYLLKPVDLHQLREVVAQAIHSSCLSRVPAVFDQEDGAETGVDRIVGLSGPMQEVYKKIGRVAPQDVNVLILGESGTGKELVARAIYSHSRRSKKPFLAINCAAIPETLLESELFGHERGSFTGADRRRIGKFEQAHGGTVFLDEIGDMTFATQAKILRLLQDGRFERVGGNETIADGRPRHCRDQQEPGGVAQGRQVPRRPLLPAQRVCDPSSAAARADGRPADAGRTFCQAVRRRTGKGAADRPPGKHGTPGGLRLAGKHSRAAKRDSIRAGPGNGKCPRAAAFPAGPAFPAFRRRPHRSPRTASFPAWPRWCASSWNRARRKSTARRMRHSIESFSARCSVTPRGTRSRPRNCSASRAPRFGPSSNALGLETKAEPEESRQR